MQSDTRALVIATAFALVTGRKVAGLYDHDAGRHRRIAAEARGSHVLGYDGDRDARFGGSLPEVLDASSGASIHMTVWGVRAEGYDRASSGHFNVEVGERQAQLFDHAEGRWFAFDIQTA